MKFCDHHWSKLRSAIELRGLDKFVAPNADEAINGLIEGQPDPLMAAHTAIVCNAMSRVGLALMIANDDGSERCPICYIKTLDCGCSDPGCTAERRADGFELWIDRAADEQLERFVTRAQA